MTQKLSKAEMINEIIGAAKFSAELHDKYFDAANLFFELAFASDEALISICKGLRIETNKKNIITWQLQKQQSQSFSN